MDGQNGLTRIRYNATGMKYKRTADRRRHNKELWTSARAALVRTAAQVIQVHLENGGNIVPQWWTYGVCVNSHAIRVLL